MNSARRHVKRARLQKHREAMTTAIAGGSALATVHHSPNHKEGDRSDKGKGKGKEKGKKE